MAKTEVERAYDAAVKEIRRVARAGETALDLSAEGYRTLDRIPEDIASLTALQALSLNQTAVSDLAPLAGLTALQKLSLKQTAVSDLAPLASLTALQWLNLNQTAVNDLASLAGLIGLENLWFNRSQVHDLRPLMPLTLLLSETPNYKLAPVVARASLTNIDFELRPTPSLHFADIPATRADPRLDELSRIADAHARSRQALAYLKTLPPWPEPYTPGARPDGQPPQPIGRAREPTQHLPALRTPEAQVGALLRHAIVTRVTASQLADQIAAALRGLPASDGNQLPPLLQLMAEFGEVLDMMGRAQASANKDEQNLRLRLAQLEVLVERLTLQLADAENAAKDAEALARKDGFMASYKKSLGTSAAVVTAGIVTVGVPTAAIYFLGVEHPLVQAFLTAVGRLPK